MLSAYNDHNYVGNVLGVVEFVGYNNVPTTGLVVLYKDKSTLYLRRDGEFLNMEDLSTSSLETMKIIGGLYKGRNVAQVKDMLFKSWSFLIINTSASNTS